MNDGLNGFPTGGLSGGGFDDAVRAALGRTDMNSRNLEWSFDPSKNTVKAVLTTPVATNPWNSELLESADTFYITSNITMPAPTPGRLIRFVVPSTSPGDIAITTSYTFNGRAPNGGKILLGPSGHQLWFLATSETNWDIFPAKTSPELWGDGSDGDVTISTPTTLTRDMYYRSLIVNDILSTGGYRIFCTNFVHVGTGTGIIQNSGTWATTTVGAAGAPGVTVGQGSNGGTGGGGSGGAGTALNPTGGLSLGANGGTGGNGSSGLGGSYGTRVVWDSATHGSYKTALSPPGTVLTKNTLSFITGGSGGGGGAGDGGAGGGGGGGGGVVYISAPLILGDNATTIAANGGRGSNALGTNRGGGGGGGGGVIILIQNTRGGYDAAPNVSGGNGGSKTGTGTIGGTGLAGTIIEVYV